MARYAVIVVDMLNDFVTGSLGCDNAKKIVEPLQRLCDAARERDVPVVYANDSHLKGIDRELELWGDHAVRGAQAVGGAVGHNEISIIIPCHRVVGTNGSLTGYAGGIDKKISLLKLEHTDMSRLFIPKKGTAL